MKKKNFFNKLWDGKLIIIADHLVLGANVNIISKAEQIEKSAILICQVGSFKKAMKIIKKKHR